MPRNHAYPTWLWPDPIEFEDTWEDEPALALEPEGYLRCTHINILADPTQRERDLENARRQKEWEAKQEAKEAKRAATWAQREIEKAEKKRAANARARVRDRLRTRLKRVENAERRLDNLRRELVYLQSVDWQWHTRPDWLRGYSVERRTDPAVVGLWRARAEADAARLELDTLQYRLRVAYIRQCNNFRLAGLRR